MVGNMFGFDSDLPPVTAPAPIAGSVAAVLGQEAPATVTGWLVVYPDVTLLCDALSDDGASCAKDRIEVDFTYAPKERPTDLVAHGDVRVSPAPVTLTGSLKSDMLSVGVTP